MLAALSGLLAGTVHVLTGPDHLAAIAPLAVKAHRSAALSGLRWGVGHSAGVGVVGGLALICRGALPLDWISGWGERLVGILLFGLGAWSLRQALRVQIHSHSHVHDGEAHAHIHFHSARQTHASASDTSACMTPDPTVSNAKIHPHPHPHPHAHAHAAFGIGTLHGLAGSSHFLGVLPAIGLPQWQDAVGYLVGFGFGTIGAMGGFAALLGQLAKWFATDHLRLYRGLMYSCSLIAFAVGGWWLLVGPF